jgi:hypothetical protein
MDVETAIALANTAAGSAATEAGRAAWQSLATLARRITGRHASPQPGPEPDPSPDDHPEAVVSRIADHARADADFAARLCEWAAEHRATLQLTRDESTVHNTIARGAQINGAVIQARDIHGGVSFS